VTAVFFEAIQVLHFSIIMIPVTLINSDTGKISFSWAVVDVTEINTYQNQASVTSSESAEQWVRQRHE
jgi:hypothetical protein